MQARPTEAGQVAEQQKDAADLLTKHRTTPDSLRKSLYGKRSKQVDKETAAVTQLEANQAQVTNIGEACTTTGRAPDVLSHPSLACRGAETTARGACTTHQTCGDSNCADYDVTRMCKEGARCSERKTIPCYARGQPDAVLTLLCEPSTRQSLNMLLERQCSSV